MDILMSLAITILSFLVVLSVVVFVHEYGHFIVARWCGVKVEAFSLGFGPELWGFYDRKGTRWRIAAIPLGGYVKFFGDANAASQGDVEAMAKMSEEERATSLFGQPVWKRAAVVFAGPFFNFVLAFAIFFAMFSSIGRPVIVDGQPVVAPRISEVQPDGAGMKAGFQAGDLVRSVDGTPIDTFAAFYKIVAASADKTLHIVVTRANGEDAALEATPARHPWGRSASVPGNRRRSRHDFARKRRRAEVRSDTAGPDGGAGIVGGSDASAMRLRMPRAQFCLPMATGPARTPA